MQSRVEGCCVGRQPEKGEIKRELVEKHGDGPCKLPEDSAFDIFHRVIILFAKPIFLSGKGSCGVIARRAQLPMGSEEISGGVDGDKFSNPTDHADRTVDIGTPRPDNGVGSIG